MISDAIKPEGSVEIVREYRDGTKERTMVKNTVLRKGRMAMAKVLANHIDDEFSFYITRMIFGDGGTKGGVKRLVEEARNGLFGTTRISKPVIANIDSQVPTQVILTSILRFEEPDIEDVTLNEMALMMANGDLYSMTTFGDLTKTEEIQITFNWYLSFV